MEIMDQVIGNITVLKLSGRLDSLSAVSLKDRVRDHIKDGSVRMVIDMEGVDFVDSSGLGSLVACLRSVKNLGGDIRIAALQERVRAVFELIRLHHIFDIFDGAQLAVDSFRDIAANEEK